MALCNAWINLNTAYTNFFKHKSGYPKFKTKKKSKWSYTTNNQNGTVRIENHKIKLPKIDFIKIKYHREIPRNSVIKSVTVTKTRTDKYYVSILVEYDNQVLPSIPHTIIGLDYSMGNIYVDSNGNKPKNIEQFLKDFDLFKRKLARANRSLARKKKFSKNFYKQKKKVALIHEKMSNKRLDFLHKISKELTDTYDCIAVEDISVKTMAKRKKGKKFSFGHSVSRNGWYTLTTMFEYKLYWKGKTFTKVDKYFASSQLCGNCGNKNPKVKDVSVLGRSTQGVTLMRTNEGKVVSIETLTEENEEADE